MGDKIKKKIITCEFCRRSIPYTEDCRELFGRYVCPDCVRRGLIFMDDKIEKRIIICEFCGRNMPYTEDCRELFGRDICPDCVENIVKVANRVLEESANETAE